MKIVIELSEAQESVLELLGEDTQAGRVKYADSALNNKLKSSAMSNLKSVVLTGEASYKKQPAAMRAVMDCATYISVLASAYYEAAASLGGRAMKPLDELVREILDNKSAIQSEE